MTEQTPHLSLPFLMPSQAQKHLTHNEALIVLDALVQLGVSAIASEPPPAPGPGERFIVGLAPTGAFAGMDRRVALWSDGAWMFLSPRPGWLAFVASAALALVFDGEGWVDLKARTADRFGVGATADSVNRLAVSSPAVLFDHAGHDSRVKVNKARAGDTASLLFQENYSGRAEMGIAGGEGFRVKVSPDGTTWRDALVADPAANVGIGTSAPAARLDVDGTIRCRTYRVSALPVAAAGAGQIAMVSDEAGGAVLAFSDGTNWRRVTDRAVLQAAPG